MAHNFILKCELARRGIYACYRSVRMQLQLFVCYRFTQSYHVLFYTILEGEYEKFPTVFVSSRGNNPHSPVVFSRILSPETPRFSL